MLRELMVLALILASCAERPTRRGRARGRGGRRAHGEAGPRGALLDQQVDYRIPELDYIDDYPDDVLGDFDYQVTPERKPDDPDSDDYDVHVHGKGKQTTLGPPTRPSPEAAPTRKQKRYKNGTLYDDYIDQCAGLISGGMRERSLSIACVTVGALITWLLR